MKGTRYALEFARWNLVRGGAQQSGNDPRLGGRPLWGQGQKKYTMGSGSLDQPPSGAGFERLMRTAPPQSPFTTEALSLLYR